MGNWFAIYTKSRNEKKVANRLRDKQVEVYCPLSKTMRQWSDRKKLVEVPVFPSYVFVKVQEKERIKVLETPGVIRFVYWLGKPAVIRESEIEAIRLFLEEHTEVAFRTFEPEPGMRLKIREGALKENEGVVKEVKKDKVVLRLERVGFELTAEVHISKLDKI